MKESTALNRVSSACKVCLFLLFLSGTVLFSYRITLAGQRLEVVASILPQKYFVEKIGGERVHVSVMVEPGANPATYEPRPQQMAVLARASIYFSIGVPFESVWLERFRRINPDMAIVPTQEGIALYPAGGGAEGEDRKGCSATGIMDPHIWLSPPLVMVQARNIVAALIKARAEDSKYFQERYLSFIQLVARTDLKLLEIFQDISTGRNTFMVYHPCWGYFARAYGLKQVAIEEGGREPKPARLAALAAMAKKMGIRSIFIQPQYSRRSAEAVAGSMGAGLIPADPLAYEWDRNLLSTAGKIKESLR